MIPGIPAQAESGKCPRPVRNIFPLTGHSTRTILPDYKGGDAMIHVAMIRLESAVLARGDS